MCETNVRFWHLDDTTGSALIWQRGADSGLGEAFCGECLRNDVTKLRIATFCVRPEGIIPRPTRPHYHQPRGSQILL